MDKVIAIKPMDNFTLWVKFADHKVAYIDIRPYIKSGVSVKLLEKSYFNKVKIDEFGGVVWENGFDFCPNFLREIAETNDQKNKKKA